MQRAPGADRLYRVAYGEGELEFMAQPWFDVDVVEASRPPRGSYDIVVAGVGRPHDIDLARTLRAASRLLTVTRVLRDGGAIVVPAQLDDGAGEDLDAATLGFDGYLVVIAASESPEIVRVAKLRAAVDVEEALDIAYEHIGRPAHASVLLVPRAFSLPAEHVSSR